ncbi:conjugative transposon protein TraK [Telluribacter sp.]|jgi:conjugative transposon TraK protein|uniref:conjugative transposon protein TraK n=1 Tax=Telluribacter sp. TaxID=1978767 RepID=UPI002E10BE37|nr:conjugative transposon protein TraK [Telluribacter sp.]
MKELIDLEKGHQRARLLVLTVVVGCLLLCCTSVIVAFKFAADASKRIFVVNRGVALEAFSANVLENRPAEAVFHVTRFHELFFTNPPDARSIEANFIKASFLADESVKLTFDRLKEDTFYQKLIQTNTNQKVVVEKVDVDMKKYPYKVRTVFKIIQERATNKSTRLLASEAVLVDVTRSEVNPQGFLLRNFRITQRSEAREEIVR